MIPRLSLAETPRHMHYGSPLHLRVVTQGRRLLVHATAAILLVGWSSAGAQPVSLNGATVDVCFTPGTDCAGAVVDAVNSARERVWLLGYGFSEDAIVEALGAARRRGLDVRVILDRSNEKNVSSGAGYIGKIGVPVWIDKSVRIAHNKLILIDRDTIVMGSLNWTKSGNTRNAENVHILRGAHRLADRHEAYFRSRQAVSEQYKPRVAGPQSR